MYTCVNQFALQLARLKMMSLTAKHLNKPSLSLKFCTMSTASHPSSRQTQSHD